VLRIKHLYEEYVNILAKKIAQTFGNSFKS